MSSTESKVKEYKCHRGACSRELTVKEFGKNIAYFCPDHGLVRTELYYNREEEKEVAEVAPVEVAEVAPVEVTDHPIPAEDEAKTKRTRTRTKKTVEDSQE